MGVRLEIPEPLIRVIETTAAAEHLTPGQFMRKLVDKHLENKNRQELIERGRRQSQALGLTEEDPDRLLPTQPLRSQRLHPDPPASSR